MTVDIIHLQNGTVTANNHWTAEGPVWDAKRDVFWYTDIEHGTLHRYNPADGQTIVWRIGVKNDVGKQDQMIGGATAVNPDGSLVVILEGGENAGVNYFNPDNGELVHIKDSWVEADKANNRPNDSTVVDIGDGKRIMIYGTMSKEWNKGEPVQPEREGAFYALDENMQSHRLKFEGDVYPGTVISNGLAGTKNDDGTVNLFWAETVGPDETLKVFNGTLDPKTWTVSNVKMAADHKALTDGKAGRPDGANMIKYKGRDAYAVAALQTGEIRIFDPATHEYLASLKLPEGLTNITKFAVSNTQLFVTTIDFDYAKKPGGGGVNGSTHIFPLPAEIQFHPAAAQTTSYPSIEEIKKSGRTDEPKIIAPEPIVNLGAAKVTEPATEKQK